MDTREIIKKRVLEGLPFAYNKFTMSGLGEWVEGFQGAERDYASRVMGYLERLNSNPSTRVFGVGECLLEDIARDVV